MHEFGHGLYEAQVDPALERSPLGSGVSLGLHESQSRMWENLVGRSKQFWRFLYPQLQASFPQQFRSVELDDFYGAVNAVRPSFIRIDADEVTYNLHIVLRFELELAMIEGRLGVDDVPAAGDEGMQRLLGIEVPGAVEGVLQDIHWSSGLIGYFPTYSLGNLMAAQIWRRLRADLPELDAQLERGEFAPLREWLREHVHRHGRTYEPRELLRRITGEELRVEPLLDYLRAKLEDAGVLSAPV
jgi:carboxypeptidase Taq